MSTPSSDKAVPKRLQGAEARRGGPPWMSAGMPAEKSMNFGPSARRLLRRLLPDLERWTPLAGVAPMGGASVGPSRASYVASTLSASLELVKEGILEARQMEHFSDIYLRTRAEPLEPIA